MLRRGYIGIWTIEEGCYFLVTLKGGVPDASRRVSEPVAVTDKEGLVVGMRSMPSNPYDGHTLPIGLEQVEILTASVPSIVLADCGYRGVEPPNRATRQTLSHTRKLPPALKRLLKRRQVFEPVIGHMKSIRPPNTPCRVTENMIRGHVSVLDGVDTCPR
jgi:hypothetical protein